MKKLFGFFCALLVAMTLVISPALADETSSDQYTQPPLLKCYHIQKNTGGVPFDVVLALDFAEHKALGKGMIDLNSPYSLRNFGSIKTNLHGDLNSFTWLLRGVPQVHTYIKAVGYPEFDWPKNAGIGPVIPQNTKLDIYFDVNTLKSGSADFQYRRGWGDWTHVSNATVESCS